MELNEKQLEELKQVTAAVIKWINENCHPHTYIIIDTTGAEVLEGVATVLNDEYIRD